MLTPLQIAYERTATRTPPFPNRAASSPPFRKAPRPLTSLVIPHPPSRVEGREGVGVTNGRMKRVSENSFSIPPSTARTPRSAGGSTPPVISSKPGFAQVQSATPPPINAWRGICARVRRGSSQCLDPARGSRPRRPHLGHAVVIPAQCR